MLYVVLGALGAQVVHGLVTWWFKRQTSKLKTQLDTVAVQKVELEKENNSLAEQLGISREARTRLQENKTDVEGRAERRIKALKKELQDMEARLVRVRDPGAVRTDINKLLSGLSDY